MNAINVIAPYKHLGMWVFDDPRAGTCSPSGRVPPAPGSHWRRSHDDHRAGLCGGRAVDSRDARATLRTGSWCSRVRSVVRSRPSMHSRGESTTSRTATLPRDEKRAQLERLHAALDSRRRDAMSVALADARARFPIPTVRCRRSSTAGCRISSSRATHDFEELRGVLQEGRRRGRRRVRRVYGSDDVERAETLGIALQLINIIRDVARGLGARPRLSPAGRARGVRRHRGRHRRRRTTRRVAGADDVPGRTRPRLPAPTGSACSTYARRSERPLRRRTFAGLYRATLDRIEARGFDVFDGAAAALDADEAAVVGGGLRADEGAVSAAGSPGCAGGARAGGRGSRRHALRGEADARRRGPDAAGARGRPGAAAGQRAAHRARLLHRVPRAFSSASARAARCGACGSSCRWSTRPAGVAHDRARVSARSCATRICRCAIARCAIGSCSRCAGRPAREHDDETFADFLRGTGQSTAAIERFWDVFIRPALNLPADEASADDGHLHRADGAARRPRAQRSRAADEAARLDARRRGAPGARTAGARPSRPESRVETLDELDADAIVVAVPPAESRACSASRSRRSSDSPIVSVHSCSTGRSCARRWPRCSAPTRTGSSIAARSRAMRRERGPISDRRLERRARAARGARPRARRADRGAGDRAARRRRGALVAGQPGAARDGRAAPGTRRAAGRADLAAECRTRAGAWTARAGRRRWRARCASGRRPRGCCPM